MHGIALPARLGRYGQEIAIMREMGWSWRDLCEAPSDLVLEIQFRLGQEYKWRAEREKLEGR